MTEQPFFVTLKNRGLITLSGNDRYDFLQALITNDIMRVKTEGSLYACLLTPQGKFLHDFFVIDHDDTLLIDCEGGDRADDLAKRLTLYKMRRDVTLTCDRTHDAFAIFNNDDTGWKDPRDALMGTRSFSQPDHPEQAFKAWDEHRIRLTIPDGSRDMIPEQSTLLESGIDRLNGIDFDKGCYIGQELTARMHYRGLVKKRLRTVQGDNLHTLPDLRSTCGDLGIALIRDKDSETLPEGISLL